MRNQVLWVLLLTLLMGGCASTRSGDAQPLDPIEPVNRAVWAFNWNVLDQYVLRPTAVAYVEYMPGFARTGLLNASRNLEEPSNSVNNLLQGKVPESFSSVARFVVNTSVGLLGTIDVASELGLERKNETFGEVLGNAGIGTGPYLMLPFLGPNDTRSLVGTVVDNSYFALNYLDGGLRILSAGIQALEVRGQLVSQEQLIYDSVDSYSLVKSIYFQNLENNVNDGVIPDEPEEEDEDLDAYLEGL